MKKEQQRMLIAEFCGWSWRKCTYVGKSACPNNIKVSLRFLPPGQESRDYLIEETTERGNDSDVIGIPDYLNDLNAMHEAVKHLSLNQWTDYLDTLYKIVQDPHICPTTHAIAYVEATAAQRAEALLRTIGKWVETKQEAR